MEEEKKLRVEYERKPNNSQKASHQKSTGFKGHYILEQLAYHNRMHQMSADCIQTIVDFISNVMGMLVGKCNEEEVKSCEKTFQRFGEI